MDQISAIARSVLYEGYILWPYSRTALKNQKRWTFGGVYPEAYSNGGHADDACRMRTECLLEIDGTLELEVRVRFLHVVDRTVAHLFDDGARFEDSVVVNGVTYTAWQEAVEREVVLPIAIDPSRAHGRSGRAITIDAGESSETLPGKSLEPSGLIVRRWAALDGSIHAHWMTVAPGLVRVGVEIGNHTAWHGGSRDEVSRHTLGSTHTVLHASAGRFVSAIDPPPALAAEVARCACVGTWPVLVGQPGDRDTMLSSAIILYDYPEVAPESSGDFFDAGEIDQLLVLSVLSMTEEEQRRMRECDPRAREILERCQSLSPEELLRLHGATRELRRLEG